MATHFQTTSAFVATAKAETLGNDFQDPELILDVDPEDESVSRVTNTSLFYRASLFVLSAMGLTKTNTTRQVFGSRAFACPTSFSSGCAPVVTQSFEDSLC
jgi:hypothetical protein